MSTLNVAQFKGKDSMIKLNCAGDLKGMQIEIANKMIASVEYSNPSEYTIIKLKKNQSCRILVNNKLAGYLPLGAEVMIDENPNFLSEKLSAKMIW